MVRAAITTMNMNIIIFRMSGPRWDAMIPVRAEAARNLKNAAGLHEFLRMESLS